MPSAQLGIVVLNGAEYHLVGRGSRRLPRLWSTGPIGAGLDLPDVRL